MKEHLEKYVEQLKIKDNHAFEIVYYSTYKGVFSLIYSIVLRKDIAEELMQETYIRMMQKLNTYQTGNSFVAWLFQIAKNISFDYLRKMKREETALNHIAYRETHEAKNHDDLLFLETTLQMIDPVEKEIIILKHLSNLTFHQIATIHNLPLGTVYSIYRKGIKKLEKEYRKESK
ncbi:MAG: RNA polymerase sigma factor [Candidatus Izemoplasmatales bacterium]